LLIKFEKEIHLMLKGHEKSRQDPDSISGNHSLGRKFRPLSDKNMPSPKNNLKVYKKLNTNVSDKNMPSPKNNLKVYKKLNTNVDLSGSNNTEPVSFRISELSDPKLLGSPTIEETQYLQLEDKYKKDQDLRAKRQDRL
jgi:hypothetical protein